MNVGSRAQSRLGSGNPAAARIEAVAGDAGGAGGDARGNGNGSGAGRLCATTRKARRNRIDVAAAVRQMQLAPMARGCYCCCLTLLPQVLALWMCCGETGNPLGYCLMVSDADATDAVVLAAAAAVVIEKMTDRNPRNEVARPGGDSDPSGGLGGSVDVWMTKIRGQR